MPEISMQWASNFQRLAIRGSRVNRTYDNRLPRNKSPMLVEPHVTTGPILLTGLAVWQSLLCLLDLRAKGQDGLQGPVDPDGEAGYPRHHPHDRTAVPAGAPGHDLVLTLVTAFGEGRHSQPLCSARSLTPTTAQAALSVG
jgi:hypothetical protein